MMTEQFKASVQYDDWIGTAAADHHDDRSLSKLLQDRGLFGENDFLVGATMWLGENHGTNVATATIRAVILNYDGDNLDSYIASLPDPLPTRTVELDLTAREYAGLFKRLAIALSARGLQLEGRSFVVTND